MESETTIAVNKSQPKVRGYIKPLSSFHTLDEWEEMAMYLLDLQGKGLDTRGGEISCKHSSYCNVGDFDRFVGQLSKYFGYQLSTEVDRWDLLTKKNMLDFIEDFVNHRLWAVEREFGSYFPDIRKLKLAYFYSRGDMEPYVLIDDEFTTQLYGSTDNPKELLHYTSKEGLQRLEASIESGNPFDISTFTVAMRPFFRAESNIIVHLIGNVRGGFRSDIKSMAVDNKRRALNLYRLDYPGHDQSNICYELGSCDGNVRTSLWNEYIATPTQILNITWT
jgi:hypothetical protein